MPCPNTKRCPAGAIPYIVREGDTLDNIAKSYNTSVESILASNVNLNIYNLNIGQIICIPLPNEAYPSCRTTNYYIAQEGDTFFSIGQKFGVNVEEIINSNLGVMPENIYTGIILCLPVAPSPVCLKIKSDGSQIILTDKRTQKETVFKSSLSSHSVLLPQRLVVTKKALQSGDVNGAKELLFSPFEIGIRGESKMPNTNTEFIETDNKSMLQLFNSCPVGTIAEVIL